jgi:hypothetical protein
MKAATSNGTTLGRSKRMKSLWILLLCAAALLAGGGSALANTAPETVTLDPIVFTDVNPCTGEAHIVTLTLTLRAHEFELTDPARHHGTTQLAGTIATSDGFSGRITEIEIDNGAGLFGEDEGRGMATAVTNGIARDDSGAGFSVHLLFHVTVVNGEPLVVVDRFRLECLG